MDIIEEVLHVDRLRESERRQKLNKQGLEFARPTIFESFQKLKIPGHIATIVVSYCEEWLLESIKEAVLERMMAPADSATSLFVCAMEKLESVMGRVRESKV